MILGVCFSFLLVAVISGYYVIDQMFLGSEFNFFKSVVTEEITVEQFLNTEYSDMVEADLKEKGYTLDVSYEYSDVYAENVIFEQTPEAGSVRKLNNFTLKLTVSPAGKQYLNHGKLYHERVPRDEDQAPAGGVSGRSGKGSQRCF